MINFELQNHKPLREIVYEELKLKLLTGAITPETRLMEIELAATMGVSRTPIREAIRQLEKEGLVTIEPRKGAYASKISTKDMVDILEVRQELDGLTAYFAASRMSKEQQEKMRLASATYNQAVEAGDMQRMIDSDTKFHKIIVESCNNKVLEHMSEQLQESVLRFRFLYYDKFRRAEQMPAEHQSIIDAICNHAEKAARSAAETHIARLKELVIQEGVHPHRS